MTTLQKRANGPQCRMLKIVSGSVLDAAHAHPHTLIDSRFARSVAKRAVGTLSAQWPEVLAAGETRTSGKRQKSLDFCRSRRAPMARDGEGSVLAAKADPLSKICDRLGRMIKPLRMAGDLESAQAIRVALAALSPLARKEKGKGGHG